MGRPFLGPIAPVEYPLRHSPQEQRRPMDFLGNLRSGFCYNGLARCCRNDPAGRHGMDWVDAIRSKHRPTHSAVVICHIRVARIEPTQRDPRLRPVTNVRFPPIAVIHGDCSQVALLTTDMGGKRTFNCRRLADQVRNDLHR